jgi:hypothetical protein
MPYQAVFPLGPLRNGFDSQEYLQERLLEHAPLYREIMTHENCIIEK